MGGNRFCISYPPSDICESGDQDSLTEMETAEVETTPGSSRLLRVIGHVCRVSTVTELNVNTCSTGGLVDMLCRHILSHLAHIDNLQFSFDGPL